MIDFSAEVFFQTARSGGKGGQNVNKVETLVEAWWHPQSSQLFTDIQKQRIQQKLANKISKEGYLLIKSQVHRSQLANKKEALEKMLQLVNAALLQAKKRVSTKPSKAMVEKRLASKKQQSEKKMRRKKDW